MLDCEDLFLTPTTTTTTKIWGDLRNIMFSLPLSLVQLSQLLLGRCNGGGEKYICCFKHLEGKIFLEGKIIPWRKDMIFKKQTLIGGLLLTYKISRLEHFSWKIMLENTVWEKEEKNFRGRNKHAGQFFLKKQKQKFLYPYFPPASQVVLLTFIWY